MDNPTDQDRVSPVPVADVAIRRRRRLMLLLAVLLVVLVFVLILDLVMNQVQWGGLSNDILNSL